MPCRSASTSSCERICWFMAWALRCASLDDEAGVIHTNDGVVHIRTALALAATRLIGLFLDLIDALLIFHFVTHGARRLAANFTSQQFLAFLGQKVNGRLV